MSFSKLLSTTYHIIFYLSTVKIELTLFYFYKDDDDDDEDENEKEKKNFFSSY
jgi:hypothetical protein